MYDSLFNPTTLVISFAIYSLLLLCIVLTLKLVKLEKENRKNVSLILYLHDRVTKLEEEDDQ